MTEYKTEQERFWAGAFGDDYIDRNRSDELLTTNKLRFAKILSRTQPFRTAIEFGANIGLNLRALHALDPKLELAAIEINARAVEQLRAWGVPKVYEGSILEFEADVPRDMALIAGVLIHINPDELPRVYRKLHAATRRYLLVSEYFNPTPVEVPYRGHGGRLFKRDFAGEILDLFPDLKLVDYGFEYSRDPRSAQDDATWFLLEKARGSGEP